MTFLGAGNPLSSPSRRRFLQLSVSTAGGLLVGFWLPGCNKEQRDEKPSEAALGTATKAVNEPPGFSPNAFIAIDRAGQVTLTIHKVEMGQGTFTSLPMLLAEELEVDLDSVNLQQAPADNSRYADPLLGGQITGGSTSVRGAWKPLREAAAATRMVLIEAAADKWGVDASECRASSGSVMHVQSGRKAHYGELVDAAAKRTPPTLVRLKPAGEFKLIGRRQARLDSADKVNGKAQFGIDVRLPQMKIATVSACPVPGGKLKSVDKAKALAVSGVRQVLKIENAIAVVGDHMWAAKQGLAAAAPTWSEGVNAGITTTDIVEQMRVASETSAAVARRDGDAVRTIAEAKRKLTAIYEMPFLAHATMEPINCTVDLKADGCDLYVGTQVPAFAQGAAAQVAGLPAEKVRVHNQYIGGGFGRRLEVDSVVQAVAFARLTEGPVKFVWTREEDIQHDMYRPYYYDRISAALDADGMPSAWMHRITGSSIMSRFAPESVKDGVDSDAVEGARDIPYKIKNILVEYVRHEPPIPTAFWRGVGPTHNIFVVESFIDELAHAARRDPVAYRMALLESSPRTHAVLDLAASKAHWNKSLPAIPGRRVGRGVSAQFAFGSYMAQVVEASVGAQGDVQVHRVVCAVDCGQVVNPDTVVAQVESGVIFGLTAALWNEITVDNGRVQQSNFGNYRMMRINEAPRIEVHITHSSDEPGGIGEPGTSAIAPALCNAIFAATGKRLRQLPISRSMTL